MKLLENIVLETPYLFLKKVPYAWIAAIALWTWPPIISGVLIAIIALGLLMMSLQRIFWESKIRRECHSEGQVYRARPRLPMIKKIRNLAIVFAGSALIGLLLQNQLRLTGIQWFLLAVGFALLYRDYVIFGPTTVYLVTSQGIGVFFVPGHVDYRLFFRYGEMDHITQIKPGDELPQRLDVLSPQRGSKEGVLLKAKRYEGFSSEFGHILLTPPNPEEFILHVPATLMQKYSLVR